MTASTLEAQTSSDAEHVHQRRRFYSTKTFRLLCMLILTFSFFLVEIIVGNVTNSVALVADALHMLSDVISLVIALIAVRLAKRRSDINTYGWVRAEVVGANINTVFLLALCLTIIFDVIKRYIQPEPIINVNLLLIVGSVGLGINIIGLFLFQGFHGHSHGGGEAHGHSHQAGNHSSKKTKKTQKSDKKTSKDDRHDQSLEIDDDTSTTNHVERYENKTGKSKFKRHSERALKEAMDDCASNADNHSHDHHAHGHSHDGGSSVGSSSSHLPDEDGHAHKDKAKKASSMNMHGVFLHVLADALGSVVVIISALLIKFVPHDPEDHKHWTIYIDPTLTVIIVIVITMSTVPLFRATTSILLQTIPQSIEVDTLKKELLEEVPEVNGIHELHIWRLTNEKIIASAHLHRGSLFDYMVVADKVKRFFHSKGIHSTTMQYEYGDDDKQPIVPTDESDRSAPKSPKICLLRCIDDACDTQACCTKKIVRGDTVTSTNNEDHTPKTAQAAEVSIQLEDEPQRHHSHSDYGHGHSHASIGKSNDLEKF